MCFLLLAALPFAGSWTVVSPEIHSGLSGILTQPHWAVFLVWVPHVWCWCGSHTRVSLSPAGTKTGVSWPRQVRCQVMKMGLCQGFLCCPTNSDLWLQHPEMSPQESCITLVGRFTLSDRSWQSDWLGNRSRLEQGASGKVLKIGSLAPLTLLGQAHFERQARRGSSCSRACVKSMRTRVWPGVCPVSPGNWGL